MKSLSITSTTIHLANIIFLIQAYGFKTQRPPSTTIKSQVKCIDVGRKHTHESKALIMKKTQH